MKIETAEFRALFTPELERLSSIFSRYGHELRFAGGPVRDLLMGVQPKDLDFATTATPDEMRAMFESEGVRMINNRGEKHGTVTCRINDKVNYEVTTLRVDVVTDGRHAEVEFTRDWRLDAERRDLTINSMFLGLDGTLYDYFAGRGDVEGRRVRFVGDATARIQEDYLRILRYFRFYGRISEFAHSHDGDTLRAIRENAAGLDGVSGERIWVEMKKIVAGPRHVDSLLRVMSETSVLLHIGFPQNVNLDELDRVYKRSADLDCLPMTYLSALLLDENELTRLHARVKMSRDELQLGQFILAHRNFSSGENPPEAFTFAQDIICDSTLGPSKTKDRLIELFKYINDRDTIEKLRGWELPKFPVGGVELIERRVPRGPKFSRVLGELRERWKRSRFTLGAEELLAMLDETGKLKNESD